MPYLDQIVAQINAALQAGPLSDSRFRESRIESIAVQAEIKDDGANKIFIPLVYNKNGSGDYKEVTFDDVYPLTLYHRVLSNSYAPVSGDAYGATKRKIKATTNMLLCVMAFKNQVKLSPQSLEALMVCNFPLGNTPEFKIAPLQTCILTVTDSNMDSLSAFQQEFKGLNVDLNPEKIIFFIKYKIESTYYQGCFNICDCESSNS